MRTSKSMWSKYVNRLFGNSQARAMPRRSGRRPPGRLRSLERLEDRSVLSATFGSVLSIGNEVGSSSAADVATDQAGNSYMTGSFSGTVDFDQAAAHTGDADILTARGPNDIYVAKYAPDDSLAWVRRMGGDGPILAGSNLSDGGANIAIDGSGNVYVAGGFVDSGDFGSTTLSSAGESDGFVAKLDADGTIQWAKSWGTAGREMTTGLGVDAAGNAYALSFRLGDAYDIVKFSPTGVAVWGKSVVAHSGMSSADLTVNATGDVFVAGTFDGTVDFDPSSKTRNVSSGPNMAAFVLKLDTNGKFGWVSPFVGHSTSEYSFAQSLALDGSGNIIVGGAYTGAVDFNPGRGTTTLPTQGGFITKLNSSGNLVWARALEHSGPSTFLNSLAVDTAGNIYATGTVGSTADLDPGSGTYTLTGGSFVMQLTAAGNFGWAETFVGASCNGIAVDPSGVVHVAGMYRGTVDFDPDPDATANLTTTAPWNGFRLRLRQV